MPVILRRLYTADGPYPLGKYDTLAEEWLAQLWLDSSADERSGDVDAPTGAFALILLTRDEVTPELVDSYGLVPYGAVGNHVMRNNSQGFVWAETYDTPEEARARYAELEDAYSAWDCEEQGCCDDEDDGPGYYEAFEDRNYC